jgi:hypothetical protein
METEDDEQESESEKYLDEGHYTSTIYAEAAHSDKNDDGTYCLYSETMHNTAMNKTADQRRNSESQEESI